MAGGILSGHDGSSGRGTHALCVKSRKTNTLISQALHIRSAIPFVQRLFHRISCLIYNEGNGSIHQPHIID